MMSGKGTLRFFLVFASTLVIFSNVLALNQSGLNVSSTPPFSDGELNTIKQYLFNNITTEDHVVLKENGGGVIRSIPGAVLASPANKGSAFIQDYQFHWVRDAAITMQEVIYLYSKATLAEKKRLRPYLINYINFENKAQKQTSRPGEQTLGQPKYNIDGTVWEGEWGRPQNDGAALRAIALCAIAEEFLREGEEKYVREMLIDMITLDLDYIVREWRNSSFDLWEEVNDQDHFYTKMVQRKGLINGAALLEQLGDAGRANGYLYTANQITESLDRHWKSGRGYFTETVNQQYYKGGGINSSIILGVLHGDIGQPDDRFGVASERVMSSVYYLRNSFSGLYRINIDHAASPPMLGRYPNDVYDGDQNDYGNPWVLATNALAQYYYALANVFLKQGKITVTSGNLLFFQQIDSRLADREAVITQTGDPGRFYSFINALILEGDKTLSRVRQYAVCYTDFSCLHFAEQLDRATGKQTSARDLTWNYASLLAAMQTRLQWRMND
ncbi:hypothetical protein AQUSIP_00530 [Aquicella siphonis]|uniref:glucan 1,4-alpha-glucosidase n=1 Tax=Aquicella siphonis TaxID=254247 RepID=A0A5E4PEJ7_9COXI|nr:glycoside hydrolase family 15 protein [Aquicella siphonis]VVC74781.1 hypothetical protein AQUSIP_00530 [Aquicella siphonis]